MDKETLSNYGWIVICVLVLAVMIALAGPFGNFVADAVKSTTQGLFDVNQGALDAAGVPGLTVQDQEFDVPDMNGGLNNAGSSVDHNGLTIPEGAIYISSSGIHSAGMPFPVENYGDMYIYDCYAYDLQYNGWCVTLLNEEVASYLSGVLGVNIYGVSETLSSYSPILESINGKPVTSLYATFEYYTSLTTAPVIPASVTNMPHTFNGCTSLTNITYAGTMAQWNAITFGTDWNENAPATYVQCSDGQVPLS